jgi:ribosomal protein L37AE/L43A
MRPKWVPHYGVQAASGHAQDTQALLRLCSGMLTSAQVKAAVAQVRRLKRNQRKGKLILSLGESFLLETPTKRQINLSKQWEACFMLGQRIEIRMIFQKQIRRLNSCPSCGYPSEQRTDKDIACENCGLTFKRVIQIEEPPTDVQAEPKKKGVRDLRDLSTALSYDRRASESLGPPRPSTTEYERSRR